MAQASITTSEALLDAMRELGLRQVSLATAAKISPIRLNRFVKGGPELPSQDFKKVNNVIRACRFIEKLAFLKVAETAIPIDWHRLLQTKLFDSILFIESFEKMEHFLSQKQECETCHRPF